MSAGGIHCVLIVHDIPLTRRSLIITDSLILQAAGKHRFCLDTQAKRITTPL